MKTQDALWMLIQELSVQFQKVLDQKCGWGRNELSRKFEEAKLEAYYKVNRKLEEEQEK